MSERPLDAERVAALLDGRLSASERELVLAQIAADPEWREVLADAASAVAVPAGVDVSLAMPLPALQGAPRDALDEARRAATTMTTDRRTVRWAPIMLAASVILAVALGTWRFTTRTASPFLPTENPITVALEEATDLTRDQVTLDSRWPRVRALTEVLTARAIGVRVGAMSVDMLARSQPKDSATLSGVREELVTTLQLVPGSGPIVSGIQNAATNVELEQALRSRRLLVDSVAFDAGDRSTARRLGVGFVPADRHFDALFEGMSALVNTTVCAIRQVSSAGFISRGAEHSTGEQWLKQLRLHPLLPSMDVAGFSGGNQQKIIVARSLAIDGLRLVIALEPTRGVDVGARAVIHDALRAATARGVAVVIASSDLDEVCSLCQRVYLVSGNTIRAELQTPSSAIVADRIATLADAH